MKPRLRLKSEYLTGFGLGTALTPLLIRALGTDIPVHTANIVWFVGVAFVIVGIIVDRRMKGH